MPDIKIKVGSYEKIGEKYIVYGENGAMREFSTQITAMSFSRTIRSSSAVNEKTRMLYDITYRKEQEENNAAGI